MKKRDFYSEIKHLHMEVVDQIRQLMLAHGVDEVDLLGSSADHAFVYGRQQTYEDVMEMEVSRVYLRDGVIWFDVILDIDTEELASKNEKGDIGDAYQCWEADDFSHFIPCSGVDTVYESVYQVLEYGRFEKVTCPVELEFFSIEDDGRGGKQIHVLGYLYTNGEDNGDGPWRNVEYTGFIEPLEDFVGRYADDEDYVENTAAQLKQYIGDHTDEEAVEIINSYFCGHPAGHVLHYSEVTTDTPCGDYCFGL